MSVERKPSRSKQLGQTDLQREDGAAVHAWRLTSVLPERIRRRFTAQHAVFFGALASTVIGLSLFVAPAWANAPIKSFAIAPSTTQAGGHPDIVTSFTFDNRDTQNFPTTCFCQDAENTTVELPAGVIGVPHATPQCTAVEFGDKACLPDSQVGVIDLDLFESFFSVPVYNLVPHVDQAGLLGFQNPLVNTPAFIVFSARTGGDFGLDTTLEGITHVVPPEGVSLDLWGVPDSASHDAEREPIGGNCSDGPYPCFPPTPSHSPALPFIDNPTSCSGPLSASLEILAYDNGTSNASATYPATTGCDQLSFNPSLFAQPTTTQTDAASGIEVNLHVPQEESPTTPSPSEIRATTVTLPEGFSINPSAADGKTSCSDAEARFGTEEEAQCPEFSKIGTATVTSAVLPGPISGFLYLGEPKPGDRYRVIVTANGFATHIKLGGSAELNPQTGQVALSLRNLPQTTFSDLNLHFFGSERGLLATPTQCGTYPVKSTFTPWDSQLPSQSSAQFFTLDSGPSGGPCPGATRPFTPGFEASSVNSTAGSHSPFSLDLTRPDGDQNLSVITDVNPPGFSATLKGVPYCADAALAAAAKPGYSGLAEESSPSCPAASQIGTADTGAGAGTHPVYLPGKVYLAGPYKGAPLSLAVIAPAVSGPYDLGNVVVRAALHVNPETAQITAVSDPLPQILQGIPLRLRSILINLDRPNFTLNPTNCDPFSVTAQVTGDQGAQANLSSHFQVANCASLSFNPALALKFSGSTKRAGNPALKATVTYPTPAPYANIASTAVSLPPTEQIDNAHIQNPCTKVQFNLGNTLGEKCPAGSLIGFAKAETPLLANPLEGLVYFRSAPENKSGLPDIVAVLKGQIEITLDGKIDTIQQKVHGERVPRIRTTFPAVPDAPVSKFTLSLDGGNKGLLVNSANLCSSPQRINVKMVGQNGKTTNETPLLTTPCGQKKAKRRSKSHANPNRRAQG
jgi:hypothetical protein